MNVHFCHFYFKLLHCGCPIHFRVVALCLSLLCSWFTFALNYGKACALLFFKLCRSSVMYYVDFIDNMTGKDCVFQLLSCTI